MKDTWRRNLILNYKLEPSFGFCIYFSQSIQYFFLSLQFSSSLHGNMLLLFFFLLYSKLSTFLFFVFVPLILHCLQI